MRFAQALRDDDYSDAASNLPSIAVGDTPVDFDFTQMLKNTPMSAYNLGEDMASIVAHPIDTTKAVWGLLEATGNKLGRLAAETATGQDLSAFKGDSEQVADQVGQFIVDRYGSIDAAKTTLEQDPIGALADLAGIISGGGIATRSKVLQKIGAAAEPINVISNTLKYGAGKIIPKGMPAKMYEEVAKFSTVKGKKKRGKMIETAMDERIPPTHAGVDKMQAQLIALRTEIDTLIDSVPDDQLVDASKIKRHLEALKSDKAGFRVDASKDMGFIDDQIAKLDDLIAVQGGQVTVRQMHEFKKDIYDTINYDKKQRSGSKVRDDTYKGIARGAKEAVEEAIPGIKELNAKQGRLMELERPLEQAAARIGNRDKISFTAPINTVAGAYLSEAVGIPPVVGAGIGAGLSAAFSPKAKAHLALSLDQLRKNATVSRFANNNPATAQARLAAAMAGRLTGTNQ